MGTGTEPERTSSGIGTFKILGIETFVLMNKVSRLIEICN